MTPHEKAAADLMAEAKAAAWTTYSETELAARQLSATHPKIAESLRSIAAKALQIREDIYRVERKIR